ncbi:MAG: GNAT family N-acetyltransferase [Thermoplasmata archaeon]|nr:GNAT family N-acetyltransferase [Thermoplasmata archaeon]
MAATRTARFELRPLTVARWGDFDRLFRRFGGVAAGCWCTFYHRTRSLPPSPLDRRRERNRRDHRRWLGRGQAHGVLVFEGGEPIGWCQFGPVAELPRTDSVRSYRSLRARGHPLPDWRTTCFFVDPSYCHRGAARAALSGALAEIRAAGGGLVGAYPATGRQAVGSWFGSVPMFARAGFRLVAPFGPGHRLMQRRLRRSTVH